MFNQQLTIDGRAEDLAPAHKRVRLFEAPRTIKGQMPLNQPKRSTEFYIGRCKHKGCGHASRVLPRDVQELDTNRWATSASTGERVYVCSDGRLFDPTRPYRWNGISVSAKCPDHGSYDLKFGRGRFKPDHKCDARCTGATGPKCDCSCGGANHGADHA